MGVNVDSTLDQRFCFKLMTPNRRDPITIKTIGPHDFSMWLNGIKSSIMKQLCRGRVREDEEGSRGIGTSISSYSTEIMNNEQQRSSEVEETLLDITSSSSCNSNNTKKEKETKKQSKSSSKNTNATNRNSNDSNNNNSSNYTEKKCKNEDLWNRVREANPTCADCGRASPDWVSLNFGILICVNCSGVHRSLGTHMSKVRSLSLDSLSDREAHLVLALGNVRMNNIFERKYSFEITTSSCEGEKNVDNVINSNKIPKPKEKPVITEHTDRVELEKWIKRKYVTKELLLDDLGEKNNEVEMTDHRERASKDLYDASCSLDINRMAYKIALGADVNWKCAQPNIIVTHESDHKGMKEKNETFLTEHNENRKKETTTTHSTPLGVCLRNNSEENKEECIELLLQNGSAINLLSNHERFLLDKHLSPKSSCSITESSSNTNATTNATTTTTNATPISSGESHSSSMISTLSYDDAEEIDDDICDILTSIESLYIPGGSRHKKK